MVDLVEMVHWKREQVVVVVLLVSVNLKQVTTSLVQKNLEVVVVLVY